MFLDSAIVYGHGTDNAWDEAVYLVTSLSGFPDSEESIALEVSQEVERKIIDYAERRIEERPLAYLLGVCRYAGHDSIKEGVVIFHLRLDCWSRRPPNHGWERSQEDWTFARGGCLGILAAHEYPAEVVLVDKEPLAVDLAKKNVQEHDLVPSISCKDDDIRNAR